MERIRQNPFVRILFPFVAGIYFADYYAENLVLQSKYLESIGIITTLVLLAFHFILKARKTLFGILIVVHFFCLGSILYLLNNPVNSQSHFSHISQVKEYVGLVQSVTSKSTKQEIEVDIELCVMNSDSILNCEGKSLLYYLHSEKKIEAGDRIQFSTDLSELRANPNPHTFDYGMYLFYNKIQQIGYLQETDWKVLRKGQLSKVEKWANLCREHCYNVLKKWIQKEESLAIANAMLLGQRDDLDEETKDAFINTGAIHVLAVSGLHVGILSMIILWFLNRLPVDLNYSRIIKWLVYMAMIWMFALVTGSGPAVLRASLMFSFYFTSIIFSKNSSSFNNLAAAAFLILLNNPYQLFTIGFQFSFLALSSILLFMPMIQRHYQKKHKILQYGINLVVLSFVAQILVAPLSISYFNQFAVYFVLSGLIAVPSAFIILCASISLIAFDFFIPVCNEYVLAPILNTSLDVLVMSVHAIQELPGAVIRNLFFDPIQIISISAVFVLCVKFLFDSRKHLLAFCLSLCFMQGYACISFINSSKQQVCYVYNVPRGSAIDFFIGDQCYEIISEGVDLNKMNYTVQRNRTVQGIKTVQGLKSKNTEDLNGLFSNPPFYQLGDKVIFIVSDTEALYSDFPFEIDYLVLSHGVKLDLEMLLQDYLVEQVIIDSSFSKKEQKSFVQVLENLKVPYSLTKEKVIKIDG